MNAPETWRSVVGYEGRYEVSDLGRVRIVNYRGTGSFKVMKCSFGSLGYRRLGLTAADGTRVDTMVHSLVAEAFLGPRPESFHVNHKNGMKGDNYPHNLEYVTAGDNLRHALRTGLMRTKFGTNNHNAKLNEAQVLELWSRVRSGEPQASVARSLGITKEQVYNILHRKSWAWLAPAA